MIAVRNREIIERRLMVAQTTFQLVSTETALDVGYGRFGFSASYRHSSAVRSEAHEHDVRILDHVMIVRLAALAVSIISMTWRRANG